MRGIEERLGHREVRTGFHLGAEAANFLVEVVGQRIYRYADGVIRSATQILPRPIHALIQAAQNFYETNRIHFVNAAGFGVIAHRRRVAGDGQRVAHAAH